MSVLLEALKKTAAEKQAKMSLENADSKKVMQLDELESVQEKVMSVSSTLEMPSVKGEESLEDGASLKIEQEDKQNLFFAEKKQDKKKPIEKKTILVTDDELATTIPLIEKEGPLAIKLEEPKEAKTVKTTVTDKNSSSVSVNQLFERPEDEADVLSGKFIGFDEFEEDKKDDDWSLSQIPGYQQYSKPAQKKEKVKKMLGSFSIKARRAEDREKLVKIAAYSASVIVFLLGLFLYSLHYYDAQLLSVEKDLKKYQLARNYQQNIKKPTTPHKITEKKKIKEIKEIKGSELTSVKVKKSIKLNQVAKKEVMKPKKIKVKKPVKKIEKIKKKRIVIKKEVQNEKEKLAFVAYQQGDYNKAEQLYRSALRSNSKNILALSGLGAIAIKKGDVFLATSFYQRILQVDDSNEQAQQALFSLGSMGIIQPGFEKNLKNLIEKRPGDAKLKFALGNFYAKNNDWNSAQKQYFSASVISLNNQLYALNLAISMDRLSRHRQALSFYKKSVGLAEIQGFEFDEKMVRDRMKVLADFIQGDN